MKVCQDFEKWTFTNVRFSKSQNTFQKKYYFDRIQEIQFVKTSKIGYFTNNIL